MKDYPETHQQGHISIENIPDKLRIPGYMSHLLYSMQGDFGIQIAKDGRVWICIDGIAFIRFQPERMSPRGNWTRCSCGHIAQEHSKDGRCEECTCAHYDGECT